MYSIPSAAVKYGGLNLFEDEIKYSKSRFSGSTNLSYIMCINAGCMPGQVNIFTPNPRIPIPLGSPINENLSINAFKRESYLKCHLPIGPQPNCCSASDAFTFDKNPPYDDTSYVLAVKASYRQIYGNFQIMDSERSIDLERRLRNGDITIQEFIRGLAKSPFYRSNYFEVVSQQRFIELSFKHILGRPPENQEEIISKIESLKENGFESHIDTLVDSTEYQEAFGSDTVPFPRCWNSPCGLTTSSFIKQAVLTKGFATSDNAIHKRPTLADAQGGSSQLIRGILPGQAPTIKRSEKM
ncbi:phycobilisome rod-core linker polypeptide [Prochlorococcus sp. MIT 1341]|uniref:phycobilisome rod-core linker polypeptide n=1 Tax=Prochlorococcus sp. MIT 1341 TaxID=3096221 RepID=UPI002A750597|nr:phycobilisome rod-core linker polypeptide [Prochlorococcus sp. MIT 1341]